MVADLLRAAARRKSPAAAAGGARPRPTAAEDAEKPLGLVDLVGIGVGGTLGSGLFLLAGRAARDVAGPGVTLSFALAAVACLFSGMSYAEMSSRDPDCGGAYAFTYAALGELAAFLVGCCLTLEYGIASAAIARSWASYLGEAVTGLPSWTVGRGGGASMLASLLVLAITAVLAKGMKEASWFINGSTLVYGTVVAVIIVVGLFDFDVDNMTPFLPYGMTGVLAGSSAVFFAFIGFDEIATVAEEARDAANSVPLAMMLSLGIVAVVYVAATLVLVGMVNYTKVDIEAPFGAAFNAVHRPIVAKLVGLGTALGMVNTTLVSMAAQPRIFVSMGRDGLLPRSIASTTRETTIRCGVVASLFAFAVPTELLADVVSGGTLIAFLATNMALMNNRVRIHEGQSVTWIVVLACGCLLSGILYRLATMDVVPMLVAALVSVPAVLVPAAFVMKLDMRGGAAFEANPPSFLCFYVPALPIAGVLTTTFLLTQLSGMPLAALAAWLLVSSSIYFLYGLHNSRADGALLGNGDSLVSAPASYDCTNSADSRASAVDD